MTALGVAGWLLTIVIALALIAWAVWPARRANDETETDEFIDALHATAEPT